MMIRIKNYFAFKNDLTPSFILGILCLIGIMTTAIPTQAREPAVTTHYDVAFAYAKLTGTTPNYQALLQADRSWRNLGSFEKLRLMPTRITSLEERFARFSPTSTPLTIRVPVRVQTVKKPPALVLGYLAPKLPYFPFWDGTRILTLYTEDLPLLSILPVDDDLARRRAGYMIDPENNLFLDLIPSLEPAQTPVLLDGEQQTMIPTRIARASLLNQGGETIWNWTNPAFTGLYELRLNRF